MEEKKLTDEEIVKDIKANIKYMHDNGFDEILVDMEDMKQYLDLIHRLQAVRSRLECNSYKTSWKAKFFKATAEIERLTEELDDTISMNEMYVEKVRQNAELQRQVDELKKYAEDIYKKAIDREEDAYSLGFDKGKEQSVKDTAKEIWDIVMSDEINKGGQNDLCELEVAIKERYGVEVE